MYGVDLKEKYVIYLLDLVSMNPGYESLKLDFLFKSFYWKKFIPSLNLVLIYRPMI